MSDLIARIPKGYTPGPWFVSGVRFRMNNGEWHSVNRYDGTSDQNIACVGYDPRTGDGHSDAKLIALAPELAEALTVAQAEIDRLTTALEAAREEARREAFGDAARWHSARERHSTNETTRAIHRVSASRFLARS